MRFDYEIVSADDQLLVSGHTVHACLDSDEKPARLPSDMKEKIEEKIIIS
jgi:acyl-CoA thioesterase FadM